MLAAGKPLGSVERITLGKSDGLPHVVLRIDGDYRLHRGATADLRLASNSGELNRVVALTAGSGPPLASGATLPRSRTDQPVEIDEVLGTLVAHPRGRPRRLPRAWTGRRRGLVGRSPAACATVVTPSHETASLLGALDSDGHSLRTLVAKGRSAADAFAAQRAALGTTVSGLSAVLQTTAHRQREIDSSIRQLPATLATLRATLDDTRATVPDLRRLVVAGAPAARMLRHVAPQLSRTLVTATPTLQELATTVRRGTTPARCARAAAACRPARCQAAHARPAGRAARARPAARLHPRAGGLRRQLDRNRRVLRRRRARLADGLRRRRATEHRDRPGLQRARVPAAPLPCSPSTLAGTPWRGFENSFLSEGHPG